MVRKIQGIGQGSIGIDLYIVDVFFRNFRLEKVLARHRILGLFIEGIAVFIRFHLIDRIAVFVFLDLVFPFIHRRYEYGVLLTQLEELKAGRTAVQKYAGKPVP